MCLQARKGANRSGSRKNVERWGHDDRISGIDREIQLIVVETGKGRLREESRIEGVLVGMFRSELAL